MGLGDIYNNSKGFTVVKIGLQNIQLISVEKYTSVSDNVGLGNQNCLYFSCIKHA